MILKNETNRIQETEEFLEAKVFFNEYKKFYDAENYEKALELLIQSTNKGFPHADYVMGEHYYLGNNQLDLAKDFLKAIHYFSVAAKQGHSRAQYTLGVMYLKGEGVGLNVKQAIFLLDDAAKQKKNEALDLLGKIYHFGCSEISPDYIKAEWYYKIAVNQGYPPSMLHLSLLLEQQHRFEEAYELLVESIKMGHMDAINYTFSTYR